MEANISRKERALDQSGLFWKGIGRRLLASAAYYSNSLERFSQLSGEEGDAVPWTILRYKRIIDPEELVYPLPNTAYVRPKTFARHLEYLTEETNLVSLEQLVELISREEPIPERTVAITFDGGYVDNFYYAFPLIQRYQAPVTIFLPTASLGTNAIFWDEYVLVVATVLKAVGQELPRFSFLSNEFYQHYQNLLGGELLTYEAVALLVQALAETTVKNRTKALMQLEDAVVPFGGVNFERGFLNWEEIRLMSDAGVRFGSFGHRYCSFNELTNEEIFAELNESFACFDKAQIPFSRIIALPYGHYRNDTANFLTKIGVQDALILGSHHHGINKKNSATLFARKAIYEGASFCKEVFACRLMQARIFGQEY